MVDSHDGLINCWLISKSPYQQLVDDKELIVDKVVLINKQPYYIGTKVLVRSLGGLEDGDG